MIFTGCLKTPVGYLKIEADEESLLEVDLIESSVTERNNDITEEAKKQLREYFSGKRRSFDLPIRYETTPFRKRIYDALRNVPYGSTVSYRDLTYMAGNRHGFQATGQAMHHNRLMIIVPCHRVINSDGSLGGYGRHTEAKKYLLNMEAGREIW